MGNLERTFDSGAFLSDFTMSKAKPLAMAKLVAFMQVLLHFQTLVLYLECLCANLKVSEKNLQVSVHLYPQYTFLD